MSTVCKCGKGYVSSWDGKCGHCRTKKEQKFHEEKLLFLSQFKVTIGNKYHGDVGEYIGRGSPLGNPYPISKTNPREEVIAAYAQYLNKEIEAQNPAIVNELNRITDILLRTGSVTLVCFCPPKPCHGDIIRDVIFLAIYHSVIVE